MHTCTHAHTNAQHAQRGKDHHQGRNAALHDVQYIYNVRHMHAKESEHTIDQPPFIDVGCEFECCPTHNTQATHAPWFSLRILEFCSTWWANLCINGLYRQSKISNPTPINWRTGIMLSASFMISSIVAPSMVSVACVCVCARCSCVRCSCACVCVVDSENVLENAELIMRQFTRCSHYHTQIVHSYTHIHSLYTDEQTN